MKSFGAFSFLFLSFLILSSATECGERGIQFVCLSVSQQDNISLNQAECSTDVAQQQKQAKERLEFENGWI